MIKEIAILGLLLDGPKHGYEIQRTVDEVFSRLTKITTGATYYAIKKLDKDGFLRIERSRDGARPERNMCHITDIGRKQFRKLLHDNLFTSDRPCWNFNLSLFFFSQLNDEVLTQALETRVEHFRQVVEHVEKVHQLLEQGGFGFAGLFLTQHIIEHYRLDIRLYEQLLEEIRSGRAHAWSGKTIGAFMHAPNRPSPPQSPMKGRMPEGLSKILDSLGTDLKEEPS